MLSRLLLSSPQPNTSSLFNAQVKHFSLPTLLLPEAE
jgi:hypothetical protein